MSTKAAELSHSEQQAVSQAQGIVEMVRALDRTTAAEDYAAGLTETQCRLILHNGGSDAPDLPDVGEIAELREMVAAGLADETLEDSGFEFNEDDAQQAIHDHPLSVEVRSGWCASKEDMGPEEFCILLCTGGPAVRVMGELNRGEPSRAWIEHQDWGTPWTQAFNLPIEHDTLLAYCRQFCFGE